LELFDHSNNNLKKFAFFLDYTVKGENLLLEEYSQYESGPPNLQQSKAKWISLKPLVNIFSSGGVGLWLTWLGTSRLYGPSPASRQATMTMEYCKNHANLRNVH
jgi:hypothetical protein